MDFRTHKWFMESTSRWICTIIIRFWGFTEPVWKLSPITLTSGLRLGEFWVTTLKNLSKHLPDDLKLTTDSSGMEVTA